MSEVKNIPQGWVISNLVDNLESLIDYRGKTPQKANDGILTLSAKSVKMGFIDYSQAYYITKETYDKFMVRGFPKIGDVLMTTEAPLGCIARLDRDDVAIAQRLLTLRGKKNILNNDYLRLYLTSREGQFELSSRASGSTVEGIKRSEFVNVKITLPPIEEQKAIASILTAFDDKIELLQAQNKTLETLAQTIFAEWFGKYTIDDELPDGWTIGKLEDILVIKYGKDHKHLKDGNIPLYGSGGIMRYVEKALYENPSILIPRKGTLSNLFYLNEPFWSVDTMFFSKIKKTFYGRFTFLFLKTLDLTAMNVGSAVPSLTTQVLNQIPIIIPVDEILIEFDELVTSFYDKIEKNIIQIQSLTNTRDELLPRLMSGAIRVNEFKV